MKVDIIFRYSLCMNLCKDNIILFRNICRQAGLIYYLGTMFVVGSWLRIKFNKRKYHITILRQRLYVGKSHKHAMFLCYGMNMAKFLMGT